MEVTIDDLSLFVISIIRTGAAFSLLYGAAFGSRRRGRPISKTVEKYRCFLDHSRVHLAVKRYSTILLYINEKGRWLIRKR
jgi:hypothetical protein